MYVVLALVLVGGSMVRYPPAFKYILVYSRQTKVSTRQKRDKIEIKEE